MRADVAIVGGGPAGCFAAGLLAKKGLEVVVVEEHGEVGNPTCCAGIVSAEGLKELGIKPRKWVLGKLRRTVIYPPSNQSVELTRGQVEALVVDRAEFDRSLAEEAAGAGATFLLKTRCVGLNLGREPALKLKGIEGGELSARLVVGADGATSIVARTAGLLKSDRYIKCAQAEFSAEVQADAAEVYLGRSFAPGFFGWLVQAGDVCRVGIGCTEGNPLRMLRSFVEKHPVASNKLAGGRAMNTCVGLIPEPLTRKPFGDRVLLVGDAAGHVKPLTGGGIYVGISCAKLAAEVAARALEAEPDEKALRPYERAIGDRFGKEFELGVRARRAFEQMTDEDLDVVLGLLKRDDIREFVLKNFDFDHHQKLIRAIMTKAPGILRELGLKRILKYARVLVKP